MSPRSYESGREPDSGGPSSTGATGALRGLATGLAAGVAGIAVSQLAAGLIRGSVSPLTAVGGEFIDVVPPWLKEFAISVFGTNDKIALRVGIFVVLAIVSAIIGIFALRGRRTVAYGLTIVIGVIGMLAVLARPGSTASSAIPTIIGTAVSLAVLWWLTPIRAGERSESAEDGSEQPVVYPSPLPRRSFVMSLGVVGLGSLGAAALGNLLGRRFQVAAERSSVTLPTAKDAATQGTQAGAQGTATTQATGTAGGISAEKFAIPGVAAPEPVQVLGAVSGPTEFGLAGVTPFVVPSGDYYRIDTALTVPQVSTDDWSLRIHGMVDRELNLTYEDLLGRPQIERDVTLSCVSNRVGGGLVGNATWQGVLLADVLNEAGIQPGATQVASRSVDGWTCGSPTAVIMDGRDAMIAIGMNGEPLPVDHGYPARLVVPGLYGYVSATKWVSEIELTRWEDFDAYWVPRGWAKVGPVKTMARVDLPRGARDAQPNSDGTIDVAGVAWAVHRGISKVEVSIDDGDWIEAELGGVPSDDTWRQWHYVWSGATPGSHTVAVRAYDGNGEVQPPGPKDVAPDGAEGYHKVQFRVN